MDLKFVSFWTWWRLFLLAVMLFGGFLVWAGMYPLWLYLIAVPCLFFLGWTVVPHED